MTTDYQRLAKAVSFKVGESSLLINNLLIPHTKDLDPLGKIWAILRRRFDEEYGVSVVGIFGYDDAQELISCNFFLNYANVDQARIRDGSYDETYKIHFEPMMDRFREIIIKFILSPDGLSAYEELFVGPILSRTTFDALFNGFLKSIGIRTSEDDRRAAYHRDLLRSAIATNQLAAASMPIPRRLKESWAY